MRGIAAALLLVACSGGGPAPAAAPTEEKWSGAWSPPPRAGAEVVATVDGAEIYAGDVAKQMAATGATARAALDELISAALLAAEARRRGLADDPEVVETRKRERVRALLRRDFETSFDSPDDVPQAEVESIYAMPNIRALYDHDRVHTVAYVRFPVKKNAPPTEDATAHAAAQSFYDQLAKEKPQTQEAFFELAAKLPREPAVERQTNQVYKTMPRGPAVPEFARAAHSVTKVGEVARPVRTEWGWDVLWLAEILPEEHVPREQAFADIRKRRFEASRRIAFQKWVERVAAPYRVERHDALLDKVQVDSLIGLPP
jgi:peptidyl-prolyl cis-trans isomerase C